MRRSRMLAAASALALLAACSGDGGGDAAAAEPLVAEDGVVSIVGTDRLGWSAYEITSDTGELTIELICEDAVNHNLVIDGEVVAECRRGETETGTVSLADGEHEFVCTVPGHSRTMRGTITVG